MALLRVALLLLALTHNKANARAVNLSSVWLLPEEGYPVFYRYFRDRITWYEADAVCQFHHGELVTIDSSSEFDAARAYLKEMDVANFVWTGLKRASSKQNFMWPESKAMENPEGHWAVEVPKMDEPLCAAVDPSSDYRWQPLPCSGPTVAAFVCQMEVPSWALKEDGCMLTSLPSLTVTFLPEQGAVELSSDCGLDGTRRIACKGKANREQMIRQLSCESNPSTETVTMSSNDPWDDSQSTRYRRSEVTSDMSTQANVTQDISSIDRDVSTTSTPAAVKAINSKENIKQSTTVKKTTPSVPPSTTTTPSPPPPATPPSTTTQLFTTREISIAKNIQHVNDLENTIKPTNFSTAAAAAASSSSTVAKATTFGGQLEVAVGLMGLASGPPPIEKRQSSKPIPPSLKGNSPFVEPSSPAENISSSSTKMLDHGSSVNATIVTTEVDAVESQGGAGPPDSHEILGGVKEGTGHQSSTVSATNPSIQQYKKNVQDSGEDHSEEVSSSVAPDSSTPTTTTTTSTSERSTSIQDDALDDIDDRGEPLPTPDSLADDQLPDGGAAGRPNRGRLLVHPQHRSFYAYFLNRVLG